MNEEIPQPQPVEPTQQPVSMHETPHKHHGALPLITAMLGVFLVLSLVALGYVVTQYVIDEEADEIAQVIPEVVVEEEPEEVEDTLFSHIVVNPPIRKSVNDEYMSTYLLDRFPEAIAETDCVLVNPLVTEEYQSRFGITSGGLSDPEVVASFGEQVEDRGFTKLTSLMDSSDYTLLSVCPGQTMTYALLLSNNERVATMARYGVGTDFWHLSQPIHDVSTGSVWLFPDFFGEGQPLLANGFADAGFSQWHFWVPTETGAMQQIESCNKGPYQGAAEGDTNMGCALEYVE